MFSQRSSPDSRPNAWATALLSAKRSGERLLDLTAGNPTALGFPYADQVILAGLGDARALRYDPDPLGMRAARQAVVESYARRGHSADVDRVLLCASTSEAYAHLFKLLCDPGDEVLVPVPSYPLFEHLARYESVQLVPYRLAYDGEWHVDVPSLRRAVSDRSRAIIVVNPNNPTGSFLKRDELSAIGSLGLPVISDEVFAEYALEPDPRRVTSVLARSDRLVFSLGGLSKSAGLPQLKLAWIAVGGPEEDVAATMTRLELLADTFLSVNTPSQVALPAILAAADVSQAAILARVRRNRDALRRTLAGCPANALRVEGGWYAVVRLPNTRSEDEWVLELLRDGVVVQPGWFYDFETGPAVVLSLITTEPVFDAGILRLRELVNRAS